MPKLPVLSGQDACRILEQNGFTEIRRKGSHIIMQKGMEDTTITIPVPDHNELRIGTLLSIIRQSGLLKNVWLTSK